MHPLDIVTMNDGSVGMVTKVSNESCSVRWFGGSEQRSSWWHFEDNGLTVIDNMASVLLVSMTDQFIPDEQNPYIEQ